MGDRQHGPGTASRGVKGGTVLGGASCGFSYEGARHDALAREEAEMKREAGHARDLPSRKAERPKAPQKAG